MARMTLGAWIRQAFGRPDTAPRPGKGGADARLGRQVLANDGVVLGTITAVWQGADASDGAPHEETLGVQQSEQDEKDLLFIPATAIARTSDQGVILTVDRTQVTARGWRYRPEWIPKA